MKKLLSIITILSAFIFSSCTDEEDEKVEVRAKLIELSQVNYNMEVGDEFTLTYKVEPETYPQKDLKWSSSNPEVVSVTDGKIKALTVGEAMIYIEAVSGTKACCEVVVKEKIVKVERIELSQTEYTGMVFEEFELTAKVFPENAANKEIVWKSSDAGVATVLSNGKVSIIKHGEAVIYAISPDGVEAECKIVANYIPIKEIKITIEQDQLEWKVPVPITYETVPADASYRNNVIYKLEGSGAISYGKVNTFTGTDIGKYAKLIITSPEDKVSAHKTFEIVEKIEWIFKYNGVFMITPEINFPLDENNQPIDETKLPQVAKTSTLKRISPKWTISGNKNVTFADYDGGESSLCPKLKFTGSMVHSDKFTITASTEIYDSEIGDYIPVTEKCEVKIIKDEDYTSSWGVGTSTAARTYSVGTEFDFDKTINVVPETATYRKKIYISTNPEVVIITEDGQFTALKAGMAKIMVFAKDGGKNVFNETFTITE